MPGKPNDFTQQNNTWKHLFLVQEICIHTQENIKNNLLDWYWLAYLVYLLFTCLSNKGQLDLMFALVGKIRV